MAASRLEEHSAFFDGLLSLIPSKHYFHSEPDETDPSTWSRYYRVRRARGRRGIGDSVALHDGPPLRLLTRPPPLFSSAFGPLPLTFAE